MLKENWWVPNFAFIKISILKSLNLFVIPNLIRRHSELLGIEILLNTQTPENDNFTRKVFWVFEGLLKTKTLNVMISYENILCFFVSMFSSIPKTISYETMQGFWALKFCSIPKTMNEINFDETTCRV
jgi:hypothetical protein